VISSLGAVLKLHWVIFLFKKCPNDTPMATPWEKMPENSKVAHDHCLIDTRPVILAYNTDGKLQAVINQCHSHFTSLTPYVHQNTGPWATELIQTCQPWFSES
jgi:hypothetical protein